MVNRSLLASKLAELQDRMTRVRSHAPDSAERLAVDRDALDIISFNLMLCVQVCADVASHLIADEGWVSARSLAESFSRLEEHGVISAQTAGSLRQAVGLRNVVAHGYAQIDLDACFRAATTGLQQLNEFAKEVTRWAARP